MNLISIGYGNIVSANRLISIVSPDAAPIKRLVQQSRAENKVIDGTCGRRTRAVLIFDSGHIILSALLPETISQRLESGAENND